MNPRSVCVVVSGLVAAALAACVYSSAAQPDFVPSAPPGFAVEIVARVPGARELAVAPNGDLLVGTAGRQIAIVPGAEGTPGKPTAFATIDDAPDAGVALGDGALFVGTYSGVYRIPYSPGDRVAKTTPLKIASVRSGGGAGHVTTSVAFSGGKLYASVGSSCNACAESDPTRATIQEMEPDGAGQHAKAVHIRNAIALAADPATGVVWAGVAGQDELEHGHPYEIFDAFSSRPGTLDYGWPGCYENRLRVRPGIDCTNVVVPRVVFPAYETPIGAAIYPSHASGTYPFGAAYAGGAFVALHGSWHAPLVAPRVVFVPLRADEPLTAIDWSDPEKQWREFLGGFQNRNGSRNGRPTGVAVGPEGSLFVADDAAGVIYRIRPTH